MLPIQGAIRRRNHTGNNPHGTLAVQDQVLGKVVTIRGHVGGRLQYFANENKIGTHHGLESTRFVIEAAPCSEEPMVCLRIEGTELYLTQNPYGDAARATVLESLTSTLEPSFPPEILKVITEYTVGMGTQQTNFEGKGFDYTSMMAQKGPPRLLQSFAIEGSRLYAVGFRSAFGKYWRSQHWDHTVSQSPHMLRDETWTLHLVNER